jgi:prepilin-type N-terminal cleavage/methylation domain-containing protein
MKTRSQPRAFTIIEMLLALTISATLLTATLAAFDASWRAYKHTTEAASTHVVSRIVTHRVLSLIRTGTEFGPYPEDVLDAAQNPLTSSFMEFVSEVDRAAGLDRITRLERRSVGSSTTNFELWYVLLDGATNPPTVMEERPLLSGVREAMFILEYDVGPRLRRATLDLTIVPNDVEDLRVGIGAETPAIRMVASAVPRQLQ